MRERRRVLRKQATPAEKALWERLKGHRVLLFKFRRQHPVGPYILDFYCMEAKLALELDGTHHLQPDVAGYDHARTEFLEACGIQVLRFTNDQVFNTLESVVDQIRRALGDPFATNAFPPEPGSTLSKT